MPGEPERKGIARRFISQLGFHMTPKSICALTWPIYFCFADDWNPTTEKDLFVLTSQFVFSFVTLVP